MTLSENELIEFGTLIGVHGLRGDMKVKPFSPGPDALAHAREITLRDRSGNLSVFRVKRVSAHKGNALLQLDGIDSIEKAEALVGSVVMLQAADFPELAEGEYYWHQLQGLTVHDRRCGDIGILEGLFTTAAHDVYEVQGRFGEVLIPVVDAFILDVDLEGKRIQVDLPEGLILESDED